jgi:Replicase family/Primase C terminal 1 (PriCT-1)
MGFQHETPNGPARPLRQVGREPIQVLASSHLTAQEAFTSTLPKKPYCVSEPGKPLLIRSRQQALRYPYIQFHHPRLISYLIFDIDFAGAALAARDANLPPPNIIIENPANGHAHLAYRLALPVYDRGFPYGRPRVFLERVRSGFRRRLKADPSYAGLIAKNPLHSHWRTHWPWPKPYTLQTLADALFPADLACEKRPFVLPGSGRNTTLFTQLLTSAYRKAAAFRRQGESIEAFRASLFHEALTLNQQFRQPLAIPELNSIAKSAAKRAWQRAPLFSARQSRRGSAMRRKTKERLALIEEILNGKNQ